VQWYYCKQTKLRAPLQGLSIIGLILIIFTATQWPLGYPVRMTGCQVIVVVHVRVTAKDYGPGYSFATQMWSTRNCYPKPSFN
jgi:hypothetical protein